MPGALDSAALVHYSGLLACAIKRLLNGAAPPRGAWDDLTDIAWRRDCGDDPADYHAAARNRDGALADDHQQNAAYGVHQFAVRLPGNPCIYRVLIAPADAPISIGGTPADQHFAYPLGGLPPLGDAA